MNLFYISKFRWFQRHFCSNAHLFSVDSIPKASLTFYLLINITPGEFCPFGLSHLTSNESSTFNCEYCLLEMGFIVKKGPKGREAQNLTDNSSGNAILVDGAQKVKYLLRFLLINRRGEKIVLNIFTPSRAPALLFILCIYVRKPKIEHQCVKKMFIYRNRKWIVKANHS